MDEESLGRLCHANKGMRHLIAAIYGMLRMRIFKHKHC
jgi:hypothetical protein